MITLEEFLSDVEQHKLTVLKDDDLYRHLRCSNGSYCMQFDIITWPEYLAYTGDVGTFVWSRIPDMLAFFRGRFKEQVDIRYLAEKCEAADKHDGIMRVANDDEFLIIAREIYWEIFNGGDEGDTAFEESGLREAVRHMDTHADRFAELADRIVDANMWRGRFDLYTRRFEWAIRAIPWAIEQYDLLPTETKP